jgi:hypothetical protein
MADEAEKAPMSEQIVEAPTEAPVTAAVEVAAPAAEPKKEKKKFALPKVNVNIKTRFQKGSLGEWKKPEPNFTPKYYEGVEYKNRDPSNIHPDIKVNFEDVIAEPDGAHSFATIWGTSFKSYSLVKYWSYRILTAVLAVPISILWGFYFAMLAFCSIWCIVPCIKGFTIWMNFVKKVWGLMVRTFLDPLFQSMALCFSNIRVALALSREGAKEG